VDDLEKANPVKNSIATEPSLKDLTRADFAGLVYTGSNRVPEDGLYTFYFSVDDGGRLWIDDQVVVDHDGLHANTEKKGMIGLKKGADEFRLAYIEDRSDKALQLKYSVGKKGSGAEVAQAIPASWWFH
jgi:hexosaminidase